MLATSKPITCAVNPKPVASSSSASAQGSASQLSIPSLTRITVDGLSVYWSSCAAARTASVNGVRPRGTSELTVAEKAAASTGPTGMTVSMSLQSASRR